MAGQQPHKLCWWLICCLLAGLDRVNAQRTATIVQWSRYNIYNRRHQCTLGSCEITKDRSKLRDPSTLAVWFVGDRVDFSDMPDYRGTQQWIFYQDESPCHNGGASMTPEVMRLFNISHTYVQAQSLLPIFPVAISFNLAHGIQGAVSCAM